MHEAPSHQRPSHAAPPLPPPPPPPPIHRTSVRTRVPPDVLPLPHHAPTRTNRHTRHTHTHSHTHRHTHTHRDTHIYTQRDATNRITRTHGPVGCPSDHSTATALMLARSLWSAACDSSHSTPTAHVHRPIHALIRMFPAESHRARVHASCAPWCSQNHDCLANEQLQDAAKMVLA